MLRVAIIGAGPAGLMAAEQPVPVDGIDVDIFDAMPSVGRKFLMAARLARMDCWLGYRNLCRDFRARLPD